MARRRDSRSRSSHLPGPDDAPGRNVVHQTLPHSSAHRPVLAAGRVPAGARSASRARRVLPDSSTLYLDAKRRARRRLVHGRVRDRRSRPPRQLGAVTDGRPRRAPHENTTLPDDFPTRGRASCAASSPRARRRRTTRRSRCRTTSRPTSSPTTAADYSSEPAGARATSSSRRTPASASSSRPRSARWPARSGCRPASRSATSRASSTADGVYHVTEPTRTPGPRCGSAPHRLVRVRADAGPRGSHDRPRRSSAAGGADDTVDGSTPTTTATGTPRRRHQARPPPRHQRRRPCRQHRSRAGVAALDDRTRRDRLGIGVALVVVGARRSPCIAFVVIVARVAAHAAPSHDPDARRRVLGAWTEALERLAAAGVTAAVGDVVEFALRHAPAHGAGARGPAADGSRAAADRRAVRARAADDGRCRRQRGVRVDAIDAALRGTVTRRRALADPSPRCAVATGAADLGLTRLATSARSCVDERGALGRRTRAPRRRRRPPRDRPRRTARADRARSASRIWPSSWHDPDVAAVGDEAQAARDVVAGSRTRSDRGADPASTAVPRRAATARRAARRDHETRTRRRADRRRPDRSATSSGAARPCSPTSRAACAAV